MQHKMIALLNILSFIFLLMAIIALTYKFLRKFRRNLTFVLVIMSFGILLLVSLTNIFEHIFKKDYFDLFEDELEIIFVPLFIFAIFSFSLKIELQSKKEKEQSLKNSNIRLTLSIEGAREALWEWFPDKREFCISKTNCYLPFKPLTYIIDQGNWKDVVHPDSQQDYIEMIKFIDAHTPFPGDIELELKTNAGEYNWVLIRGKYHELEHSGRLITYMGTINDISNFKHIQSELEKARVKAEESEKLKTAFLNNISHEIRTPMNAIIGFSELISISELPSSKLKEYTNIIIRSGRNLLHTIDDILDISRISIGAIQIKKNNVNVDTLLKPIYQEYADIASVKGVSLILRANPTINIQTDELKLNRIFSNLIDNALKFTKRGEITVGIEEMPNEFVCYVKDTGIGIDKKYHEHIFQNFRQVEESNTRQFGGSGLGLSISKGLVNALGGKIWIESELDKGSTVYFTFPKDNEPVNPIMTYPKKQVTYPVYGGKILIAEDEDSNFIYLNELISSQFDEILHAYNGIEAIEIYKQNQDIKLILMDVKMPLFNGFEASKVIKELKKDVPIVIQTAFSLSAEKDKQDLAYCDAYIYKPISNEMLQATFSQILGQ